MLSFYTILLQIITYTATKPCNKVLSVVREIHNYRCWAPGGAVLDVRGMSHHQCLATCSMREDCHFLNYNSEEGHCQLGNFCLETQPAPGTEMIWFDEFYHNDCVQWVPENELVSFRTVWWGGCSGRMARLMTDTYAMPGFTNQSEIQIPYSDGLSDPTIVTSKNPANIRYLGLSTGCTFRWNGFWMVKWGWTHLANIAVLAGYMPTDDGGHDPVYAAYASGEGCGYFNPRTMKIYHFCDNNIRVCVTSGQSFIHIIRAYRP